MAREMRGYKLTTLAGFDVRIDASWLFIVALVIWTLYRNWFPAALPGQSDAVYLGMAVVACLAFFGCLVLHELAHSLVARRVGVTIEGITLFIFGGVAELSEEPETPRAEFLIAVAGPVASLALAGLASVLAALLPGGAAFAPLVSVLEYLATVNTVIAVFNLVPAFPLDGGRMFRAILWGWLGDLRRATGIAGASGQLFAWFLIVTGVLSLFMARDPYGLWFVFIGMFLLMAARSSVQRMDLRTALHDHPVDSAMTRAVVTTPPDATLAALARDVMLGKGVSFVPVAAGGILAGVIDLDRARSIPQESWARMTVGEAMEPPAPENTVHAGSDAYDVLMQMLQGGRKRRVVVDADERIVGVVTVADILGYFGIVRQLGAVLGEGAGTPPRQPARAARAIPVTPRRAVRR